MEDTPMFTRLYSGNMYFLDRCNHLWPRTGIVNPYFIYVRKGRRTLLPLKAYKSLWGAVKYFNRISHENLDYQTIKKIDDETRLF